MAVGTSELLDAFAALEQSPGPSRDDFREALAATLAKSQEDRRVFELVFDRFFFRAAEARGASAQGVTEGRGTSRAAEPRSTSTTLREQIREALRDGAGRRDARPRAAGDRRLRRAARAPA